MTRLIALAALAAVSAIPLAAAAQPASPPAVSSVPPIDFSVRTLANGLKVYSAVDRSTSNVTVQVWYGVGSKDDPQGRSGFAHLFEHMMFKATRDMPAEYMDRLTEDVGGFNNASTWDDFTNYYEVIPGNHLERLLWAEAQRMSTLSVDEANFHSERAVVEEELRQRVLADPYGRLFSLAIPEASFTVHPYKRPGIGSIEDLDAASLADVKAFHDTYYRPDDASLIVVGNFDPADLERWTDKYFGPIVQPKAAMPRVTAVEPQRTGPGSYDAYGPNVPLPAVAITWLGPAKSSADAPALDVAEAILSTGDSSRLYHDLVYAQGLASQIYADSAARQQPGLFAVGAVMAGGKTIAQGEAALRAEVGKLRDAPVTAAELERAKNQLVTQALREREQVDGKASAIGFAIELEGDATRVNDAIARLQAVNAADVQRVARQYLSDDRRMVIHYQAESARPGGAKPKVADASPPVAASATPEQAKADAPAPVAAPVTRESPPAPGAPAEAHRPIPVERTLANGLRVIVAKSSDLPLVTAQLIVKTGGAADPAGGAGLADLTASLLDKGAGARTAAQVAQDVEALGGQIEAGATWDASQATLGVMSDKLPQALPILADVVIKPTLAVAELDRLRTQSLDDLSVEMQEPGSIARYVTAVAVFGGQPYGHVLGGSPASLKKISQAQVVRFHAAYYRPDNAILVLTGDINPEAGFALAQAAFGGWAVPATPLPAPPVFTAAGAAKPRVIVVDLPDTGQAAVTVANRGITRADPRFYPGIVANDVLGGGYSARLNEEIRIKRGLSYGAGSSLDSRQLGGLFSARVQTKNQSAPEVVDLILAELAKLRATPPAPEEMDARKASLTGEYGRNLETTEGLAGTIGSYAIQGIPLSEIAAYDSKVRAVDPAGAESFASGVFDPASADIVVVGDAKQFLPALKAKFPTLEVIEADQLDLDSPTLRKPGA